MQEEGISAFGTVNCPTPIKRIVEHIGRLQNVRYVVQPCGGCGHGYIQPEASGDFSTCVPDGHTMSRRFPFAV